MKLLFDQNLSPRLLTSLGDVYQDSSHVRLTGLRDADDDAVWNYARENGFVIVSKDSDFRQRSFLYGFPPKVIWVRLGNCRTSEIEKLLRQRRTEMVEFCQDPTHSFLALAR